MESKINTRGTKTYKLKILEDILDIINSAISPNELLNYLIDKCIEITGALTGSIRIINPETSILEIKVFRGLNPSKILKMKLKLGEGVTGRVAETGLPLLVNNVDDIKYYIRVRKDLKSELAVPLKVENKTFGVISVDSNKLDAFTKEHQNLLETISTFAVQILQKANLIETLKDRIERQNLLLKVADILAQEFELEKVFEKIMDYISQVMNIKRGSIILLDKHEKLKAFKGYGLSDDAIERGVYQVGEGVVGKVFKYGNGIKIKDITKSIDFLNRMKIRRGTGEKNSFFAVPIKYEDKTVGVLSIENEYTSDEDFKSTFETITLIATLVSNRVYNYVISKREKEILLRKNIELQKKLKQKEINPDFVGKNKRILKILDTVNVIAGTDATVLITGPTGAGKEIIAKLIHNKSRRFENNFISINCAAIPENLLESELFGYKKGAFTDAVNDKKGKFLLANNGTIFFDEIGDLDLNLQAKILRVIQEKTIEPLGSEKSIKVDVRIIAATNKNLRTLTKENNFREDLFYRLNVINIDIPPLVERRDDIPLLTEHFINTYNKKYNRDIEGITSGCYQAIMKYSWPGNIRELENIIERAVILSNGRSIDIGDLPEDLTNYAVSDDKDLLKQLIEEEIKIQDNGRIYKTVLNKIEKFLIEFALIKYNNNQTEAADYLGIHRNTLHLKLKNSHNITID
jgi:Nif-specific regulatory protein